MKYVSENLPQFNIDDYFTSMMESFNAANDVKDGMSDDDAKKIHAEMEKQGFGVIKKITTNFSKFKYAANNNWHAYKEFWDDQKTPKETKTDGVYYKMYDSKYVIGIIPDDEGKAKMVVWNGEIGDGYDDHVIFECKSKEVISKFMDFYRNVFEQAMRDVIKKQTERLEKKKAEIDKKKSEDDRARQKDMLSSFMSESLEPTGDVESLRSYFRDTWSKDDTNTASILDSEYLFSKYGKYLKKTFDWDKMDETELINLWDEWDKDSSARK